MNYQGPFSIARLRHITRGYLFFPCIYINGFTGWICLKMGWPKKETCLSDYHHLLGTHQNRHKLESFMVFPIFRLRSAIESTWACRGSCTVPPFLNDLTRRKKKCWKSQLHSCQYHWNTGLRLLPWTHIVWIVHGTNVGMLLLGVHICQEGLVSFGKWSL